MKRYTTAVVNHIFLSLILLIPVMHYFVRQGQRPPQQDMTERLFQGITYERRVHSSSRPVILHIVTIDLRTPNLRPLVTPNPIAGAIANDDRIPVQAQRTRDFLEAFDLQIAINANYFNTFREHTPWDFYPQPGDRVYVGGEAIGDGDRYGLARHYRPAICFRPSSAVDSAVESSVIPASYITQIQYDGTCPSDTEHAVAGRDVLVKDGMAKTTFPNDSSGKPYARTAVGTDPTGQTVWLITVDGKQPLYSEGIALSELAVVFEELGADGAIALDGGGSATLVIDNGSGSTILNAPIHTKWPMRERPVANNLGFYAPSIRE